MRLLVTGGAGFIGSHFVLRHVERFPLDHVVVLDALAHPGDLAYLASVKNNFTFVHGDITDLPLLRRILSEEVIDTVVDFAAESHVGSSIEDAMPHVHTNVRGVYTLIEACRSIHDLLFLHISTDEVYGTRHPTEPPCTPDCPLHPGNPYAATKAAGDLALLSAMNTYGMRVRITRCTNNYGPHQADEKFFPIVIQNALKNKPIPLHGDGTHTRDWIYVTDHTDALECVLAHGRDGAIYHISSNDEKRNIDVARTILKILGKSESFLTFIEDRPGNDHRYDLDSSSTRALGWQPAVPFMDGIRRTIGWYTSESPSPLENERLQYVHA